MSPPSTAEQVASESRRVERVYAALARVYDAGFDWALGPGRREALRALPLAAGERVLEVGVGTGLSLPQYPDGVAVTGIDISEPMLERARERADLLGRPDVSLLTMDARSLRFPDERFDHVVAPYVISVVPEPARVMDEIRRVCRPGGTVVVVNHFHGESRGRRLVERALTRVSPWVGFRMDLDAHVVTSAPGFEVVRDDRVNMLGWWRLIVLRRR